MLATFQPFDRVEVHYAVRGTATISWTYTEHFRDPTPWQIQLQVSDSDVTSDSASFTNIGSPVDGSAFTQLTDTTQRAFGKEPYVFYRLALTTPVTTYYSPPAAVLGDLDRWSWLLMQEMIRKDLLRLQRLKVGVPGLLLRSKRQGTPCTRCTTSLTQEQTDGACPVCFGQRFVGGYYRAQGNVFVDMSLFGNYPHQDMQRGTVDDRLPVTQGHFVGVPTLASFDVWCNQTSDQRYYLHTKKASAHIRGVPFSYEVEMRLAPFSDVIYQVPLT